MNTFSSTNPKLCTKAEIGIIDDDPVVSTFMQALLRRQFPECNVQVIHEPKAPPLLDVYFVDNDFEGRPMATILLTEIRKTNPNAMVVAMSACLEERTLRELMNGGCNAVYDKNHPEDSDTVFEVVRNYLHTLEQVGIKRSPRLAITKTVSSIRDLLSEWNQRLHIANQ